MTLTTTFRRLRQACACKYGYEKLRAALPYAEYGDDTPINLLTILDTNGLDDAVWALRATEQHCDRIARLMAADLAEDVLPIWTARFPEDDRPAKAIQAARDYAKGLISKAQLADARDAAWAAWAAARDAAWAAWAAAWAAARAAWAAARDAAWDAAWAAPYAARARQIEIFKSYLQPEEAQP